MGLRNQFTLDERIQRKNLILPPFANLCENTSDVESEAQTMTDLDKDSSYDVGFNPPDVSWLIREHCDKGSGVSIGSCIAREALSLTHPPIILASLRLVLSGELLNINLCDDGEDDEQIKRLDIVAAHGAGLLDAQPITSANHGSQ